MRPVDGEAEGGWIGQGVPGAPGPLVKQQVPRGFENYLRILHPATDPARQSVRWSEVARRSERVIHPEVQWHCLVGTKDPVAVYDAWDGEVPTPGELPIEELDVLCAVLGRHTTTAGKCLFGLSTIHGWVEPLASGERLLELPTRRYVVFEGPLDEAGEVGAEEGSGLRSDGDHSGLRAVRSNGEVGRPGNSPGVIECDPEDGGSKPRYLRAYGGGQAPNLIWPADRAWCVVSEIDFDSTLLGGSAPLVAELLKTDGLECLPVAPEDSLGWDADRINCS